MYDIIVFENLGFLPQLIEKPTFLKISPLESVFEKMRFVLQTGENNIRFQTKTDTCDGALSPWYEMLSIDIKLISHSTTFYHLTNQILICIPGGHEPRVVSVDVSVFMQKERIMPLLLSTVASRWNCGDLWLFGLSSSVSWYLLPMSQWNPFASGHPDAAFGIPYVPAGQ